VTQGKKSIFLKKVSSNILVTIIHLKYNKIYGTIFGYQAGILGYSVTEQFTYYQTQYEGNMKLEKRSDISIQEKLREKENMYILLLLVYCFSLFVTLLERLKYGDINDISLISISVELIGIVIFTVFMGALSINTEQDEIPQTELANLLIAVATSFFCDAVTWILEGIDVKELVVLNYIFISLTFISNFEIVETFIAYIRTMIKKEPRWASYLRRAMKVYRWLLIVSLLLNIKYRFLFTIIDGKYTVKELYNLTVLIIIIYAASILLVVVSQEMDKIEKYAIIAYALLPVMFAVIQMVNPNFTYLQTGILITTSIVYVHGYVRENQLLEKEKLLIEKQKTALTLSQLQPHFLYNSLTSIACLCATDAEAAEKATMEFAKYLRLNLKTLDTDDEIPFKTALDFTETYLNIEKVRFGDKLEVEYDIQIRDFTLPSLILQPVVENAVKHGIQKREDGGTIRISTAERDDYYEITVTDNGVGFDTSDKELTSGTHTGIRNIRDRLHSYGHEVEIESIIGIGTKTRIIINKEKEEEK